MTATAPAFSGAADAFSPLSAGTYPGAIVPGAFFSFREFADGNQYGELGLQLDLPDGGQRVVRIRFRLASLTSLGIVSHDREVLAKWADLVGAAPGDGWGGLVRNLWTAQRDLAPVGLAFTIRPYAGRGYALDSVEVTL
jgi:hypothetical protein